MVNLNPKERQVARVKTKAKKPAKKKAPSERNPDETPTLGNFLEVVKGPHDGRYGIYLSDGDPPNIVVRTRDDNDECLLVDINDTRPTTAGRR